MRGRGGNNNNNNQNRKGPNPLTRSYESNGPDVKIRGTAQQIAEKYTTLARDAQSSGDRVMAENYLQHAEHYNRIIMAAQAQMPQPPVRDMRDEDDGDEDGDDNLNVSVTENERPSQQHINGSGPQPVIEGVPAEVAFKQESETRRRKAEVVAEAPAVEAEASTDESTAEEAPVEEAAPRRTRRPRRPRVTTTSEASAEGEQPAVVADAPATEAAE